MLYRKTPAVLFVFLLAQDKSESEFVLFNWYILVPVDGLQLKVKPD